jgi:hypothetical protein
MILIAWVFSRWMALVYLAAFWSLGSQILGLIGSHGILPVADFLHSAAQEQGARRFWLEPTLCWVASSDQFLLFLCWGGAVSSILFFIGVMPTVTAFLLWLFYLSLTVAGQEFLGFQWDNLLLEAGLLLIFLLPPCVLQVKPSVRPSRIVIWLFRWLLFRLVFESGMVKLLSADPTWSGLTALTYHYWTQPLPNAISWYAAQAPVLFQKISCIFLFAVELVVPFLIFAGRWGRLAAFFGITALQVLILLTGNYGFFNFLAIGLCLTLLEDVPPQHPVLRNPTPGVVPYRITTIILAAIIVAVSLGLIGHSFCRMSLPAPVTRLIIALQPLRSINNYGLFAVMTTVRNEIIVEGSNDGQHWLPYEFRYKPGDVRQAPKWMAPHMPRLDWQMWFAALGSFQENPWFTQFLVRLLQGEPSVLALLAQNPFPGHPPQYIRGTFWDYHFTDFKTRHSDGAWWRRQEVGLYSPAFSLK